VQAAADDAGEAVWQQLTAAVDPMCHLP
jgi:hypothetical protein